MPKFQRLSSNGPQPESRGNEAISVDLRVNVRGSGSQIPAESERMPRCGTRQMLSTVFRRSGTNVVRGRMRAHRFGG
jgi:hypothetical protein